MAFQQYVDIMQMTACDRITHLHPAVDKLHVSVVIATAAASVRKTWYIQGGPKLHYKTGPLFEMCVTSVYGETISKCAVLYKS